MRPSTQLTDEQTLDLHGLSGHDIIAITSVTRSERTRTDGLHAYRNTSATDYEYKVRKSKKLPDIILKTKTTASRIDDEDEVNEFTTILTFDGEKYREEENQ